MRLTVPWSGLIILVLLAIGDRCDATAQDPGPVRFTLPKHPACGMSIATRRGTGPDTEIQQFPWTALIAYRREGNETTKYFCSGALINERYIVTAAHCLAELSGSFKVKNVRLGEWDLETSEDCEHGVCAGAPIDLDVEKITLHENYTGLGKGKTILHDIALIRLGSDVVFSNTIFPICLAALEVDRDAPHLLTGWRLSRSRGTRKVFLHVHVKAFDECVESYRQNELTLQESTQLCTESQTTIPNGCIDEPHGSLVREIKDTWYLVGLPSFGPTCDASVPSVYTHVSSYVDWIRENMY